MPTILNTLYPPVVGSFQPAFIRTTDARVYFSISQYNSSSGITQVHLSLTNQLNNENVLNTPSGLKFYGWYNGDANSRPTERVCYSAERGMYYIDISPSFLKESGGFNINQFYKVQIRLSNSPNVGDLDNGDKDSKVAVWLTENLSYFSEWSSVCLIRAIDQPYLLLRPWDMGLSEGSVPAYNPGIVPISGGLYFGEDGNSSETETLQSYSVQIWDEGKENLLYQGETCYTGDQIDPNDIDFQLDLQGLGLEHGSSFYLRFTYVTANQYEGQKDYPFQISQYWEDEDFQPTIEVAVDDDNGVVTIHVENPITVFGNIYVRRASSLDDYTTWETLHEEHIAGPIDLDLRDNTVASLVWYRYSVQMENNAGSMSPVYRSQTILPRFYDAIISRGDRQLKLKYDYKVSSYRNVVNRAKIDTLGSRYPVFAENAVLNYKQFTISGTLTAMTDDAQLFLNQRNTLGDSWQNFQIYGQDDVPYRIVDEETGAKEYVGFSYLMEGNSGAYVSKEVYDRNDQMWERMFREEALKWLNDGEPKLYRSMAEGNLAVMLMDVSLTPNATLGRRICSFTATVYEIERGDSLETLEGLGIVDIPHVDDSTTSGGGIVDDDYLETVHAGQVWSFTTSGKNSTNFLDTRDEATIMDVAPIGQPLMYKYQGILADKSPSIQYIYDVKIWFESAPHVFLFDKATGQLTEPNGSNDQVTGDKDLAYGYRFQLQARNEPSTQMDRTIFVNSRGYYQIPADIKVTKLTFPDVDRVTVEYKLVLQERNSEGVIVSGTMLDRTVLGQHRGIFEPLEYLGETIREKYRFILKNPDGSTSSIQQMQYFRGVCVDVDPYAVLRIWWEGANDYSEYIVGATGVLHLIQDFSVDDLCFAGRRLSVVDRGEQEVLEMWECSFDEGGPYTSVSDIKFPQINQVYEIGGDLRIFYYDGQWYPVERFDGTNDFVLAQLPVEGIVNYVGDVITSEYQ